MDDAQLGFWIFYGAASTLIFIYIGTVTWRRKRRPCPACDGTKMVLPNGLFESPIPCPYCTPRPERPKCQRCGGSGVLDSGAPGPNDDFIEVPCECTERPKCLFPDCTNREGEGRFEGPICAPCAIGLRTNGAHGTDGASRLIKAAADGVALREAAQATRTPIDVRPRHGMSRSSGVSWVSQCNSTAPCCGRRGEYNGYRYDGPTLFRCPKGCPCHD